MCYSLLNISTSSSSTSIQALPEKDLMRLTSDMSDDIVSSIQMLVDALMERLGEDHCRLDRWMDGWIDR